MVVCKSAGIAAPLTLKAGAASVAALPSTLCVFRGIVCRASIALANDTAFVMASGSLMLALSNEGLCFFCQHGSNRVDDR
jgi:hypothetical protein